MQEYMWITVPYNGNDIEVRATNFNDVLTIDRLIHDAIGGGRGRAFIGIKK